MRASMSEYYDTDPDLLEGRPFDDETPDLPPEGPALFSSVASPSEADVTLMTIHNDLQMIHFSILEMFIILFILFLLRRWK